MTVVLIDDQGGIWDGESLALRRAFDSPFSGGEFSAYVVRNLGFIAVNIYGNSYQVRIRPNRLTAAGLETLKNWLQRQRTRRLALTWFDRDWSYELYSASAPMLNRIEGLFSLAAPLQARPPDLLSERVGTQALRKHGALSMLLDSWGSLSEVHSNAGMSSLLKRAFEDRYLIVRQSPENGHIVFSEIGRQMFRHYLPWSGANGMPVQEQPDPAYGRWVRETYRDVLTEREPSIERCDAIVRWPNRGRTRLRYTRIMLPIGQAGTTPELLVGSFFDDSVDLRVAAE